MSGKVLLPKEVAEAIDRLREIGLTPYSIANSVGHKQGFGMSGLNTHLKDIHDWIDAGFNRGDVILQALVHGYKVEKTPEDSLREYYRQNGNQYATTTRTEWLFDGRRQGVTRTLDILGIKIEGVNGNET